MAFLLTDEILEDFNVLKSHLPEEASRVTDSSENGYVLSRLRHLGGVVVPLPVLLLPNVWSLMHMGWISAYSKQERQDTDDLTTQ